MTQSYYVGLEEARDVLAEVGVNLTIRQIKRAAEMNAAGKRKLPFFVDPIEGKLKIDKHLLLNAYSVRQAEAVRNTMQ